MSYTKPVISGTDTGLHTTINEHTPLQISQTPIGNVIILHGSNERLPEGEESSCCGIAKLLSAIWDATLGALLEALFGSASSPAQEPELCQIQKTQPQVQTNEHPVGQDVNSDIGSKPDPVLAKELEILKIREENLKKINDAHEAKMQIELTRSKAKDAKAVEYFDNLAVKFKNSQLKRHEGLQKQLDELQKKIENFQNTYCNKSDIITDKDMNNPDLLINSKKMHEDKKEITVCLATIQTNISNEENAMGIEAEKSGSPTDPDNTKCLVNLKNKSKEISKNNSNITRSMYNKHITGSTSVWKCST